MVEYRKRFHICNDIAKEAENMCRRAFKNRSIPAIISSSAKDADRLQDKVLQRNKVMHYNSAADIEADIVDLSVVRVALYFPSQANRAVEIIQSLFWCKAIKDLPEKTEVRTEDLAASKLPEPVDDVTTYRATHVRVTLGTKRLPEEQAWCEESMIEIQVASLLMHCWSEVNHDLIYKTMNGKMEDNEVKLIAPLNQLVLEGEEVLGKLKNSLEGRIEAGNREFNTPFELGTHILSYSLGKDPETKKAERSINIKFADAGENPLGVMTKVFVVVTHLHINTPNTLNKKLHLLLSERESNSPPNACVILDFLFESEGKQSKPAPLAPFLRDDLNNSLKQPDPTDTALLAIKTDILRYAFEQLTMREFNEFTREWADPWSLPSQSYHNLKSNGLDRITTHPKVDMTSLDRAAAITNLWAWFATSNRVQLRVALGVGRAMRGAEMPAAQRGH